MLKWNLVVIRLARILLLREHENKVLIWERPEDYAAQIYTYIQLGGHRKPDGDCILSQRYYTISHSLIQTLSNSIRN